MEAEESRSLYPRCWSHREIYLRKQGTSGVQTPLSGILVWRTTLKGSFSPITLPLSGQVVGLDAMTLSALSNLTQLEMKLEKWIPFMTLPEVNIELSQYLISSYPTPYWCSEPYSGKGHRVHAPKWHRHSVASISLSDSAPIVLYQRYDVIPPSMLMVTSWQVGSLLVPNYHYAMDFDLDLFFAISETWSLTNTSVSSSLPLLPYVKVPPLEVVELIFLLELF